MHLTSNYLPDKRGDRNAAFLRAYAAASGGEKPDHRGAGAYDAVYIIAEAIRAAGSTNRAKIRDALAQLGHDRPAYEGVTGRITFDARGDVPDKSVLGLEKVFRANSFKGTVYKAEAWIDAAGLPRRILVHLKQARAQNVVFLSGLLTQSVIVER